jgi:hypothetical protein
VRCLIEHPGIIFYSERCCQDRRVVIKDFTDADAPRVRRRALERRRFAAVVIIIIAIVAAFAAAPRCLHAVGYWLALPDAPQPADVIVVYGGGELRTRYGGELYRRGSRLLCSTQAIKISAIV